MMLGETAVVLDDLHHHIEETIHYCYLCSTPVSSAANNLCQMFPLVAPDEDDVLTPANVISSILQIDITPELSHSQAICIGCNLLCSEYQQLLDRLDSIKLQMTVSYNSTVSKLAASLTAKELVDAEAESLDGENVPQELVLPDTDTEIIAIPLGELTAVVPATSSGEIESDAETTTHTIIRQMPKLHFIPQSSIEPDPISPSKGNSRSIIKVLHTKPSSPGVVSSATTSALIKQEMSICEVPSTAISMEHFFEGPDGSMVEIITGGDNSPDYIYENVIETIGGPPTAVDEISGDPGGCGGDGATIIIGESVGDHMGNASAASELGLVDKDCVGVMTLEDKLVETAEQGEQDSAQILIAAANDSLKRMPSKLESLFFKANGSYFCAVCSTSGGPSTAHNNKTIGIHLKTEHNERLLICEHCDAVFRRRTEYNEHMDKHMASELTDFRCDVCSTKFSTIRALRMHRKNHVATQKVWPCEVCQKKYSSKNLLDEHMNMHSGKRPFKCVVCPKDFASKYTLAAHMKIHQDRQRMYSCKECDRAFYSQNNLLQHEKIHKGVRDYACEDCGKTFMSQHNLDIHKIVHLNYKPFICRTCGKGFARKAEIKDHERTHTGERPFVCEICNASFSQRSNLQSHKRATHYDDKRYKCELCNRCFKRRRLLDYHIKACHTGERPYKCDICSATFVYPEHFKKHQKIHTGTKPFACEVCSKTFNSRDNRNAHRFVHSDKKPYECVTCGAGFMRKPQLYSHMQQRGHLNDTIVVNQPRITGDDLLEFDTTTDSIDDQIELDSKDGIIFEEEEDTDDIGEALLRDEFYIEEEDMEDLDTQVLVKAVTATGGTTPKPHQVQLELSESTALLASSEDFIDESDLISHDGGGDDDDLDDEDGQTSSGLQLVKLKIANPNGKDGIAWVNLVSQ